MAAAVAALAATGGAAAAQTAALESGLHAELQRIEAKLDILAKQSRPGPPPDQVVQIRGGLDRVRRAATPGLRLYRIHDLFVGLETFAYYVVHKEDAASLETFEQLWKQEAPRLAPQPAAEGAGALLAAFAGQSQNHAEKLYAAAVPYARVTSPSAGVYYLGEALAELRFRDFVLSLVPAAPARSEPRADLGRVRAALDATETLMLAAFARDRMSPAMIPVSSALEEARQLLDRGDGEATALVIFETRLSLAMQEAPAAATRSSRAVAPPPPPAASAVDGSLGSLLVGMATDPSVDPAVRSAASGDVLPLYRSIFGSP
jgi:hypothetical protein